MAGTLCNFATQLKFFAGYDDSLDVSDFFFLMSCLTSIQCQNKKIFASHAVGGIVGNICTAIFAQSSVAGFDGFTVIPGGWLDRHWIQLPWHLVDSAAGLSYSFVMTVRKQFLNNLIFFSHFCLIRCSVLDYHSLGDALHPRPTTSRARVDRNSWY